nr:hypothetical protein HmN_000247500 [Hymenolepis microstoma]
MEIIQETEPLQQAYRVSVSRRVVIYDWIKRFKEERIQLDDDSQQQENTSSEQNIAKQDRRLTIENLALSKLTMGSKSVVGTTADPELSFL